MKLRLRCWCAHWYILVAAGQHLGLLKTLIDCPVAVQVEYTADAATVKKSFFRLSKLLHPDKCHLEGADLAMQRLNHARDEMLAKKKV